TRLRAAGLSQPAPGRDGADLRRTHPFRKRLNEETPAMTGSWNDFNDAKQNSNIIPKGTLAKVRLTIRPGGFDDPAQGWTGGYATRGTTGSVYLSGEFTVLEGPYARRKIFTLIGLYSPKGPDWANMGRSLIRGMLDRKSTRLNSSHVKRSY